MLKLSYKPSPIKVGIAHELHKPARRIYERRRVISKGIDDLWQADLVEMIPYSNVNDGVRYMLTVIDVYSKMAFVQPVKNKTGILVTKAFQHIIEQSKRQPHLLQTDQGKEFFNKDFSSFLKSKDIHHYTTYSNLKASVVERFNRTLKSYMWKEFTIHGSYRWIDWLPQLVSRYNNTIHSTIGMKPRLVTKNLPRLNRLFNPIKRVDPRRHRLKIGDFVRISKHRSVFSKSYTPQWSTEIFKIRQVKLGQPVTYLLEDQSGQPIQGRFYYEEVQKTLYPNDYLIERVIKVKGAKYFVKWLGFPSTYNSWVNKHNFL